jgi:uncharacterized protein YaiE (UPF0345 family)
MPRVTTDERMQHLETATHVTPKQPFTFDTGTTVVTEMEQDPVTGEMRAVSREEPTWEVLNPGEVFRVDHPYVLQCPQHFKPVTNSREDVETMTAGPGEKRGRRVSA